MLVAIAGCASQPVNTKGSDVLAGGVTGPGGVSRTIVVGVAAGVGGGRDGVVGAGPGYTVGNSLWNSESNRAAINEPKSLGLSLPQRYLAF
jgi:hypothetical protein